MESDDVLADHVQIGRPVLLKRLGSGVREADAGRLEVLTEHANLDLAIAEVGAEPVVCDAGGLARKLSVCRLPEQLTECRVDVERRLALAASGDSSFYVSVVQEDGYQAWSSPIYLIP